MCFIFLSNCWWIFSLPKGKTALILFCLLPTTKILAQNMYYLNNKSNRNNYFFVMFSITVSMKNKWKISTSLVYVLVIMDNRYNNSNIFFLCLAFSWWHKISCNLVASPKKDLKIISPIFSFQCTDFLGVFDDRFLLKEWHFVVVFFVRFGEKIQNRKLHTDKPETNFKCLLTDTFPYENLADGILKFVVFFVLFDEKNQKQKLDIDKPETDFSLLTPFHMRI